MTYMGVGGTKNGNGWRVMAPSLWRISSRVPPAIFSGNAMQTFKKTAPLLPMWHDEIIIEADRRMSVTAVANRWAGRRLGERG